MGGQGIMDKVPSGPATSGRTITISDTTLYSPPFRGVYVGGTGDLVVMMAQDSVAVPFKAVPAGSMLPICVSQILSSGTTATFIVGVF